MANERRYAVLIDADNVSDRYIKLILDEVSNEGVATYKRIYGDWTKTSFAGWKKVLLDYSVIPMQQYGYTTGKNATDAAMIIDAMDILYSGNVDGFCLVTSDSDFTRLAARLRESGMNVLGMGEKKTPKAFVAACNKFKYLDVLASQPKASDAKSLPEGFKSQLIRSRSEEVKKKLSIPLPEGFEGAEDAAEEAEMTPLATIHDAVLNIVRENSDAEGLVGVSDVANMLLKRYPDFDIRNYGHKKLTNFLESLGDVETQWVQQGSNRQIYLKEKEVKETPVRKTRRGGTGRRRVKAEEEES